MAQRRQKTGVRLDQAERDKAKHWWASLSSADRWTLGDQMVLGDVDWRDWGFDPSPSTTFRREVERLRLYWEGVDERENPKGAWKNPLEVLRLMNPAVSTWEDIYARGEELLTRLENVAIGLPKFKTSLHRAAMPPWARQAHALYQDVRGELAPLSPLSDHAGLSIVDAREHLYHAARTLDHLETLVQQHAQRVNPAASLPPVQSRVEFLYSPALGRQYRGVGTVVGYEKDEAIISVAGISGWPKRQPVPKVIRTAAVNILSRLNPASSLPAAAARRYRIFHEVEPCYVTERTCWVPGELVLLGAGVEINYQVLADGSTKDKGAKYVHEFESGVKIYRRARSGERVDMTWKNFPRDLVVLGRALEFSFVNDEGTFETKPAASDKLAAPSDGRFLAIVGSGGVKFVARGGKMKVTDWIYH